MKSLPSRRFNRFGISRAAGRSGSTAASASADTTVSASQSDVSAFPTVILNDGTARATITVTLRNAAGSPLSGKSVTLSATGTGNTLTQPGSVTDSNGQCTGSIVSTVAAAKTISAASEAITVTDTATVTVSASVDLDFQSDWSTQSVPATSLAAQQDTDGVAKWDTIGGSSASEVVSATGLGFPAGMANVIHVPYSPATNSVIRKTGMAIPAVGEEIAYRWYFRCDMPTSDARVSDWSFHPIQDGQAGGNCNWAFEVSANNGASWEPWFYLGAPGAIPYPYYGWFAPMLSKGTTYRFEAKIARVSTTNFTFLARIFDETVSTTVPLYDEADFSNQSVGSPFTLATVPGNVPTTGDFPFNNVNNLDGLNCGTNDTYTLTPADPKLWLGYEGGFARAMNQGWIGAYVPGEAP